MKKRKRVGEVNCSKGITPMIRILGEGKEKGSAYPYYNFILVYCLKMTSCLQEQKKKKKKFFLLNSNLNILTSAKKEKY